MVNVSHMSTSIIRSSGSGSGTITTTTTNNQNDHRRSGKTTTDDMDSDNDIIPLKNSPVGVEKERDAVNNNNIIMDNLLKKNFEIESNAVNSPRAAEEAFEKEEAERGGAGGPAAESCALNYANKRVPGLIYSKGESARVQFVHIPKAGGTSIQNLLLEIVKSGEFPIKMGKYDGLYLNNRFLCPKFVHDCSLLIGHRFYGFCKDVAVSPRGLFTIVALREPVSRLVSDFDYKYYELADEEYRSYFHFPKQVKTLAALVKYYNSTPQEEEGEVRLKALGNQQTRYMCGYDCDSTKMTMEQMLARALQNLNQVEALGVTEALNDLLKQLQYKLFWFPQKLSSWPEKNRHAGKKSVVDEQAWSILKAWSRNDVVLYEKALALSQRLSKKAKDCLKWRKKN